MNNLELMRKRLEWQGGVAQEDRMIKDKYRTFLRTLKYSYQGCDVMLVQPYSECLNESEIDSEMNVYQQYRALINPDKTKQDYDDKILSIDRATGYGPGDVFQWINTGTNWIIYLEALTEDAYFRGEIRRCRYKIKFKDSEGNWVSTWAAIRGPVETEIESIQKNQIRVNKPNLSLNILMPRNEKTLQAFNRYDEFLFEGRCWRVQAPDAISMLNVLEINAEEFFINRDTDDVENEMKNGLLIEPIDPSPNSEIIGETFIKPKIEEIYTAPEHDGAWCLVDKTLPVKIEVISNIQAKVTWEKMTSGQFVLRWHKGDKEVLKTIVVESLM